MVRVSPGSPSHTRAAFVRRDVAMCRSRQLSVTFSFPPTKNFAFGRSHSENFVQGERHTRSAVCSRQNTSGSSIDCKCSDA